MKTRLETKKCFKCGRVLDLSEFYPHKQMKDGHLNKCKDCAKTDVQVYRIEHPDIVRERDRKRFQNNIERREKNAVHAVAYRKKHPERYRAQNAVNNAVRDGRLKKPEACEVCNTPGLIHAHHHDYSRPLDVVWVCVKCHRDLHHQESLKEARP